MCLRAAKQARTVDGVANAVIIAGFDGATFTNTTNAGVMFLTLKGRRSARKWVGARPSSPATC